MNSGETSTSKTSQGKWVAVALGDSCLFQVRDNKLIHCFPVSSSAEFTNSPPLVSSNLSPNQYKRAVKKEDDWQKGDKFYLMTDALACWFLHQCEKKNITSELLNNLDSQTDEQFKAWISQLRDNKEIRNDDVTLICIDID